MEMFRRWEKFQRDDDPISSQGDVWSGPSTAWPLLPAAGHTLRLLRHYVKALFFSLCHSTCFIIYHVTCWRNCIGKQAVLRTRYTPTAVTSVERFHINHVGNSGINLSSTLTFDLLTFKQVHGLLLWWTSILPISGFLKAFPFST